MLISIKKVFLGGSSIILRRAFVEFTFKFSILSMITNLSLSLKDDLFKFEIKSLIWFISIFFLSMCVSIRVKFGFDPLITNLYDIYM